MLKREFLVTSPPDVNQRLDIFLSEKLEELNRSHVQKIIEEEKVKVNGLVRKSSYRLREGDKIEIEYAIPEVEKIEAQDLPLQVIYCDEHLVGVDKPSGLVVHPGVGNWKGTLVNALLFHFPELKCVGPEDRPGIVHRLDKETSGVLIVARTLESYKELQRQFKSREVEKVYTGLVWGKFTQRLGKFDWSIGRHVKYGDRMSVKTKKPRQAETYYSVIEEIGDYTLLEIRPITGRTHQIRVHLAASGHPVVGDTRYGRRKSKDAGPRLFLHASRLVFKHPRTNKEIELFSPLPVDLEEFLKELRSKYNKQPNFS